MATDSELFVTLDSPLGWVVVNRPSARNALNLAVWRRLAESVEALASDQEVRVVVVRGAGTDAFLSGADITEFPTARGNSAMTAEYDRCTNAALATMTALDKPVIAMINGLCFGGGCSVALACDVRFAAAHARFAIPAARLGLSYPFEHGIEALVQIVGPAHAADILLSGRTLTADEALRAGLVNRVLPTEQLESATREYALRLAECAPLTQAAHKAAIREARRPSTERNPARLRTLVTRCFDSADYQEGVAAFLEKRKPRFTGK